MGAGPCEVEAFQAHGRSQETELGSQHTGACGLPRRARPVDPGYGLDHPAWQRLSRDRKSTRLNSSHRWNSDAVFCLSKTTVKLVSDVVVSWTNKAEMRFTRSEAH